MIGCSDANMAKFGNYGSGATIKYYSGGTLIYSGKSTGKVLSEANSDGYFFKETSTGQLKEVSGNCVIAYDD